MPTVALTRSHVKKEAKENNMFLTLERKTGEFGSVMCYVPYHSIKHINEIDDVSCYIELNDGEVMECDVAAEDIVRDIEERIAPYNFLSSS